MRSARVRAANASAATIIVDEEAASRLRHKDYYRYAYAHKPAWQHI